MASSHDRRWWILGVLCLSVLLVSVDNTIVNVALPTMSRELSATTSQLQWVVDAYALVLAAGMLGAGDLADRLGSRRLFLAGLVAFGAASAACAVAPSASVLIAARAVQGAGAAAILPSSLAIVNQLFPDPTERPKAIGVWAGLGGSALVLGPVLGGVLVGPLGWRSIFWVNVPIVAAAPINRDGTKPISGSTSRSMFAARNARRSRCGMIKPLIATVPAPTSATIQWNSDSISSGKMPSTIPCKAAALMIDGRRLLPSAIRFNPIASPTSRLSV